MNDDQKFPPVRIPFLPTDGDRLQAIEERLDVGSARMDLFDANQQLLTDEMHRNTHLTQQVHEMFNAVQQGLQVLGWVGRAGGFIVKWMGIIAATALSVYTFFYALTHHGATPK